MNETIQIIFKVFKYVLKLQLDTLESEGAVLGDLHEQNITVMGGETREGPEGRVPGAEKLTFAVVDCSGTLPVIIVQLLSLQGPKLWKVISTAF